MELADILGSLSHYMRDAVIIAEAEPVGQPGPRVVWCNRAFTDMTGFSAEEIIGKTPRIFQGPMTDPQTKARIRKGLEQWDHIREEILNYDKSGREFWVELDIKPVADADGWFHYWVAVQRNITERKAKELELARQYEELRREKEGLQSERTRLWLQSLVASHTTEVSIVTDERGKVIWVNDAFTTLSEYTLDDILGRTPGSVLQGEKTDPKTCAAMREAIDSGQGGRFEVLNYTKSGRPYWIDLTISPVRDENGVLTHFIAVEWDATERMEKDQALATMAKRFEIATSAGRIGVWDYNVDEDRLIWDETMFDLFGADPKAFKGKARDWADRILPEDRAETSKVFFQALEGLNDFTNKCRIVRDDGVVRHVQDNATFVRTLDGQRRMIGVLVDITEEVELLERERRANRMKSEFLATVSHELRTPLNGILGMAQVLTGTDLNDQQKEYLGLITSSGGTLLSLINDILDVSRIEAGLVSIEIETLTIRDLLRDMVETFRVAAASNELTLDIKVTDDVPTTICADDRRLRQVLFNLLGNAVKFTAKGSVTLDVAVREKGDLLFKVIDTGPGVPSAHQKVIFERFHQVDGSSTRQHGGVGLGLAIVKDLVTLMGGKIGVESIPDRGATFWFTLPQTGETESRQVSLDAVSLDGPGMLGATAPKPRA